MSDVYEAFDRERKAVAEPESVPTGPRGKAAFTEWWNSDEGKAARSTVRPIMDDITALCAEADRMASQSDDDPFSNEGPSDEQRGEAFNGSDEDEMARKVREETNAMAEAA